jgi:hypothetical protein
MCDINLFRSYYIISARSICFLAYNVKIPRGKFRQILKKKDFICFQRLHLPFQKWGICLHCATAMQFIKERTGHLEKISNMDYEFFLFFCRLNGSIVNTDQESTVLYTSVIFCWRSREIVTVLFINTKY